MTATLHILLQHCQLPIIPEHPHTSHLLWDIRHSPADSAKNIAMPSRPISEIELSMHATLPSVNLLRISTDLLQPSWVIEARNALGVTVRDVLEAIHTSLHTPLTPSERENIWSQPKLREKITETFNARCAASRFPNETRSNGILRIDCFLHYTLFAGLSVITWNGDNCVLTLRRYG